MGKSGVHSLDLHLRVGLSVAHLAGRTLLGLVGPNGNLLALAVLHDFAGHAGAVHIGLANLHAVLIANSDHGERYGFVLFCGQLLDENFIAELS